MTEAGRYLALAERLADAAGEVIRPYFRAELNIESKADETPVTIADREAEQAMRAIIEAECPGHGIRGEEFSNREGAGEWCWILDPIDGTKLFITGIPLFGTLIALAHNGKPVIGVVDQPISRERWTGGMDGTARFNGGGIKTNGRDSLASAKLFTTSLYEYSPEQARTFERLAGATALTRQGTDCYAFAMLAMGFVDIVTETNLHEWDLAAHVPIIENAGGVITDWQGRPLRFDGQITIETVIAAANPALHAQALAVLQG